METVHAEYRYKAEASDTIVLFIHGIQGSPRQFDFMVEALKGTCSVENLLLPGHGNSLKDFNRSSMAKWQAHVDERVQKARTEYKNVFLVGHSMGSLLSVQAAISNPEHIRGLFLTALPLVIRITYPYFKNSMIVALKKEREDEDEVLAAARSGKSVSAGNPLEYVGGVPRLIELLRKSKEIRGLLALLPLPAIVYQSENDEIVSRQSLRYLEELPNVRILTAEKSGHYYYTAEAKELMVQALAQFIRQESVKEPVL